MQTVFLISSFLLSPNNTSCYLPQNKGTNYYSPPGSLEAVPLVFFYRHRITDNHLKSFIFIKGDFLWTTGS